MADGGTSPTSSGKDADATPETEAPNWTVDEAFVASPRPGLELAGLGDEVLAYDPIGTFRAPFNQTAALIWSCLDGEATIGELATDFADEFGLPYQQMVDDLVGAVVGMLHSGLAAPADFDGALPEAPTRPAPFATSDFPLGSIGNLAVQVGGVTVGVRVTDGDLAAHLRALLAPALTDASVGDDAPARLDLAAAPPAGRLPRMCFLYRNDALVFSGPSPRRAVLATITELSAFLPPPEGTVRLDAQVLVGAKGAVLVGGPHRQVLWFSGTRLARAGWRVVDGSFAYVDRETFEVVVPEPAVMPPAEAVVALDDALPPAQAGEVTPGRHRLDRVILVGAEPDAKRVVSPAQRVAAMMPLLWYRGAPIDPTDVTWLDALAGHTRVSWVHAVDDHELLDALDPRGRRVNRPPAPR